MSDYLMPRHEHLEKMAEKDAKIKDLEAKVTMLREALTDLEREAKDQDNIRLLDDEREVRAIYSHVVLPRVTTQKVADALDATNPNRFWLDD
jgi:chromosome segregation ATPase